METLSPVNLKQIFNNNIREALEIASSFENMSHEDFKKLVIFIINVKGGLISV